MKKANGEGRTRPHAASRWEISIMMNFNATVKIQETEAFPDRWVAYFVYVFATFDLGVDYPKTMFKKRR